MNRNADKSQIVFCTSIHLIQGPGIYLKILKIRQVLSQTWSGKYSIIVIFKAQSQNMVRTSPYVLICSGAPVIHKSAIWFITREMFYPIFVCICATQVCIKILSGLDKALGIFLEKNLSSTLSSLKKCYIIEGSLPSICSSSTKYVFTKESFLLRVWSS